MFSTDKNIGAHRLPKINKIELLDLGRTKYKKFEFFRTDFRIELLAQNKNNINQINIKKILDIAKKNNYKILTTEKDYMKVPDEFKNKIGCLKIDLIIQNESKFKKLLKKIL